MKLPKEMKDIGTFFIKSGRYREEPEWAWAPNKKFRHSIGKELPKDVAYFLLGSDDKIYVESLGCSEYRVYRDLDIAIAATKLRL